MFDGLEDDGNKKVMVFISDGVPTYYTNADGSKRFWLGNSDNASVKECVYNTIDLFNDLRSEHPELTVYTVGFGNEDDDTYASKQGILRYMANVGGGEFMEADDGDSLIPALEKYIIENNGDDPYTEVSIVDELSKYVNIAEQPDYKVTMTTDTGEVYTLWQRETDNDGNYIYKATKDGEDIIKDVSFDSDTSTVKVEFYPEYTLEIGAVYELSFNIKTSDYAYSLVDSNKVSGLDIYTDIDGNIRSGDKNTDYGKNETSSFQFGFYSNNSAYISCLKNSESERYEYAHPVIQAVKTVTYTLPSAGGIGLVNYALLTVGGTICAMLCSVVISRRRMKRKR
jgi:hypothetical protein